MNRSSFAFFVALLIHLLFLLLFLRLSEMNPDTKKVSPPEKRIKISLKEFSEPVKKIQKVKTVKKIKKIKSTRLLPKAKPPIYFKAKKIQNKPKFIPRSIPKVQKPTINKTRSLIPLKPYIPLPKVKNIQKQDEAMDMDWLIEDRSSEIRPQDNVRTYNKASAGKKIQELYGADFAKLSAGQQKYILDNQEVMRRITQEILNRQARVSNINGLNVNRSNVIEFYLYPNGDISGFKFLEKSGYFILDDITRSTIEYAYSKYPRPTQRTLIRYNVLYNLKSY